MDIKNRYRYILAASTGIILFCGFPNVNFFPFAWVSLIPLLVALERIQDWKSAFYIGYIAGFLFFLGLLLAIVLLYPYASIFATALGYILLVAYSALYIAVFAVLVIQLPCQSGILFPLATASIWVALEWVRGWLLTGFPWGNIGYSQWSYLPGIQIASVTGVYGISFLIVFFNAGIATLIRNRKEWRMQIFAGIVPCVLTILCLSYGHIILAKGSNASERSMKVAIVPGNIPQIEKWKSEKFPEIFRKYLDLTRKAALKNPDVIVWPETAIRGQILSGEWTRFHGYFRQMMRDIGGIPMLIGATDPDSFGDIYNRVISIPPDGEIVDKYAKMHLVPFGEYVPLSDMLPNFIQFYPFEHGKTLKNLPINHINTNTIHKEQIEVGTSICFESAFPNHFRQFVKQGADAMGILTNDAWFDGTAFPELHLAMAPIRAVENRIAVFRCANGGYSCVINSTGKIITPSITPTSAEEILIANVPLSDGKQTIYTRYGDWFPILCLLIGFLCIAYRYLQKYWKSTDATTNLRKQSK